jgi:hypothetical protein
MTKLVSFWTEPHSGWKSQEESDLIVRGIPFVRGESCIQHYQKIEKVDFTYRNRFCPLSEQEFSDEEFSSEEFPGDHFSNLSHIIGHT